MDKKIIKKYIGNRPDMTKNKEYELIAGHSGIYKIVSVINDNKKVIQVFEDVFK